MTTKKNKDLGPGQDVIYDGPTINPALHDRDLLKDNIKPGTLMVIKEIDDKVGVITHRPGHAHSRRTFEVPVETLTQETPEAGDLARYTGKNVEGPSENRSGIEIVLGHGERVKVDSIQGDKAKIRAFDGFTDQPEENVHEVSLSALLKIPKAENEEN